MRGAFVAKGYDVYHAGQAALGALDGTIRIQASVLAFDKIFLMAGVLFLVVLPLLFFLRVDRKATTATSHAEPLEI